jgi:protein gp37
MGGCYAERLAARFSDPGQPYHGFAERMPSGGRWTGKVALVPDALTLPLRWRKPRHIFVNSMSDLFHEGLSDADIDWVFAVMALCPRHIMQVLTKRSGRARKYLQNVGLYPRVIKIGEAARSIAMDARVPITEWPWPLPNVWLGVSVEDRARKARIDDLRHTPAAGRFLSLEPLLEDLGTIDLSGIGWVIVGAESGPNSRQMDEGWVRSIRDQCIEASVPFFYKQRCVNGRKISTPELDGRVWREVPA